MSAIQPDDRGLVVGCPQCGQRNRLPYQKLPATGRCGKCQEALPAPAAPIDIPSESALRSLIQHSPLPVLVDFWAPWCGPCKMVAPEIAKVASQGAGQWLVAKVNTEALPALGQGHRVSSIPTMVVFSGGKEIARQSGAMPADAIVQFLRQASGK